MRARRGVSLIELMIALSLLGLGLLALAAGAATLARHAARSALDARAAAVARDRIELAAAAGCGAPHAGDSTVGPLRVRWRAADDAGARLVRVELSSALAPRAARVFSARLLCRGA